MTTLRTHYDLPSRIFHWLTAIAVLAAFVLGPEHFGREMRNGLNPATRLDIVLHETLGMLVMALTFLRLLWLALRPAKPELDGPTWLKSASTAAQGVLWLLLLAVPVAAVMALGTEGYPLTLLGGIRIDYLPVNEQSAIANLGDWGDLHSLLGETVMWLSGLHALAAIFHHVVLKDGVLRSMWLKPR